MAEVGVNGTTVTQVAQRHEITRQQVYAWRHKMRRKTDLDNTGPATFLPVELDKGDVMAAPSAPLPRQGVSILSSRMGGVSGVWPGILPLLQALERGHFSWPRAENGVVHLMSAQLSILWEGIDWRRPRWTSAPTRM